MNTYDITIAGVTTAAPANGFIDPTTVYAYMNNGSGDKPSTYATSLTKSRANRRNKNLVMAIQYYSGMQIVSSTVGGTPNCDTAPTNIVVRISIGDVNSIMVKDENNAGQTLSGTDAIKRIVARALVKSETINIEVYDPTTATAPGNSNAYARAGTRFNIETVGALYANVTAAEGGITITAVS